MAEGIGERMEKGNVPLVAELDSASVWKTRRREFHSSAAYRLCHVENGGV